MSRFIPDYTNVVKSARNVECARLPLYEHIISHTKMDEITGKPFSALYSGDAADRAEFMRRYCAFFRDMGYDTVSFEQCITSILPGGGALSNHADGAIKDWETFNAYPWDQLEERYFTESGRYFSALRAALPEGMKAIGGVGNGVFECVEDLAGYQNLCYLREDEPELYEALFNKVGEVSLAIWRRFLREYSDAYCVCRFGDDLGFKSATLISTDDIKALVLPQYARIVSAVHEAGKPFLLHSCGSIFGVMEDLIDKVGIDAKHSNEDQIAPFPEWVARYGDRIGNFGGVDMDYLCWNDEREIEKYVLDVIEKCKGHGGFVLGSGNSIPDYVPAKGYLAMVEAVRKYRGDYAK